MDDPHTTTYRRMGEILAVKRFITADQLAEALVDQERTGRLLGEICVERFGLDRFALADALSEQWEEMQHGSAPKTNGGGLPSRSATTTDVEELRRLLAESDAARARLAWRTDELERRLIVLELLVTGAMDAPGDPHPYYAPPTV